MDYNTSHDIIHESNQNQSEKCPVCNGKISGAVDVKNEAARIIKQQRDQRAEMHVWGGELDAKKENALNDSDFAYINKKGERKLPIHDAAHVRNALARFNQTQFDDPSEKAGAMAKIKSKAKQLGVKVSDDTKSGSEKRLSDKMSDSVLRLHKVNMYPLSEIIASEDGKLPTEIQIMPVGEWDTVPYGKLEITASDLQEMKKNFEKGYRAGVPIDVDHDGKAAAGWIESLRVADDGLWAAVTWTDLGQKLLGEKQYKFFSPEFNPEYTDPEDKNTQLSNVLIAGSLVNRPLFKELKPVIASDQLTNNKSGVMLYVQSMKFDPKKLIAKKEAGEKLTASEKAFLKKYLFAENSSDDNDGDGNDGGGDDNDDDDDDDNDKHESGDDCATCKECGDQMHTPSAHKHAKDKNDDDDNVSGNEKKVKGITISAAEYKALQARADQGVAAAEKLEAKEIEDTVDSWMFNETGGHFAPAIKDDLVSFYKGLSTKQRKTFSELVDKMPEQTYLFKEIGGAEDLTKGTAADTLTVRAKELMEEAKKADRKLTFSQAVKMGLRENPALGEYEMQAVRGKVVVK